MRQTSKAEIIQKIRDGAVITDTEIILSHLCAMIISISESMHEGKDDVAFANLMDSCEIATEVVEVWIRLMGNYDTEDILQQMSERLPDHEGVDKLDMLLDHLAKIENLAHRGRKIIDAKKAAN